MPVREQAQLMEIGNKSYRTPKDCNTCSVRRTKLAPPLGHRLVHHTMLWNMHTQDKLQYQVLERVRCAARLPRFLPRGFQEPRVVVVQDRGADTQAEAIWIQAAS